MLQPAEYAILLLGLGHKRPYSFHLLYLGLSLWGKSAAVYKVPLSLGSIPVSRPAKHSLLSITRHTAPHRLFRPAHPPAEYQE